MKYIICMTTGEYMGKQSYIATANDIENDGEVNPGENYFFGSKEEAESVLKELEMYCEKKGYNVKLFIESYPEQDFSCRQQAIQHINSMDVEDFEDYIVRSHTSMTHEWIQVYPDGSVCETEEADNNTSHWVDYPNKEVASIYEISTATCEQCGCETCRIYRDFDKLDKEEFIEEYTERMWEYCDSTDFDEAILEESEISGEDVRQEIIANIKDIYYGYFDDELD